MNLPPYINRATIHDRLRVIFPEGVPQRTYCVREAAASTVFTMLYIGAVEGVNEWAGPKQIVRMTDAQAALKKDAERTAYAIKSLRPGFQPRGKTWYRENSREQIRDETIRQGFITNNAIVERPGVATTSGKPRYALRAPFAALFNPVLSARDLERAGRRGVNSTFRRPLLHERCSCGAGRSPQAKGFSSPFRMARLAGWQLAPVL